MALPKQVVLVPLVRIMANLRLRWLYIALGAAAVVVLALIVWSVARNWRELTSLGTKNVLLLLAAVLGAGAMICYLVWLVNPLGMRASAGDKQPMTDTLWAVILPTVGWPFGVFLMKQFSETIPNEILEAARMDGAGELRTFLTVVCPIIKPGFGALAIFTFINTWNDYFLQLIMLPSRTNLTISLGIATLQAEFATNYGLMMAGAALGAVPIVAIFLIFQKFFTQGITMGAVKG